MASELFAPVKINLSLHVTGQRADGYHLLDSLVVFGDVGDRLWVEPAAEMSLEVTGPFAGGVPADARNLVWRAAELAGQRLHIRLEKNLPHGAGIGGGSSDAAAILRAFGAPDQAIALGADVPVCLSAGPQRMQGIGERLTPVTGLPALSLLLVNPGVPLPTPAVFKALEQRQNPAMTPWPGHRLAAWLGAQRNDLEAPARGLAPVIGDVLAALRQAGADLGRMSGSGATCFGLFATRAAAERAAADLSRAHPGWWVMPTQSTPSAIG
ncbi:4-(cytidine 5'-diphospho)-2-C-methyl-D-erythritol kinase [Pseudodonghicola flavimaris]|uniref:4-diphosphocytidyl-2-C-methyl-D-erythritol kinase n=1 Tax=Pseudodonghicola flavimaris TaxID=3050036 RepID=A0ABT7EX97_9RHOB|nr:4-(cytidine 5'-diphospho)-2-C-methyl-D-erythritol kinase [Pseudodonghicola flavimaris]MDK3016971.1 4-(cytidine 5'-diphospho)-2-C-methyl-D-erythritol kinase [Pseudodonghicola flavimaris]